MLQSYVGFTLSHILSSCHSWRYAKRSQRWDITTAALQVLQAAMTSPLTPQAGPNWSVAQAVAEALSKPGHPAAYLFINLPPHAGQRHQAGCCCCHYIFALSRQHLLRSLLLLYAASIAGFQLRLCSTSIMSPSSHLCVHFKHPYQQVLARPNQS